MPSKKVSTPRELLNHPFNDRIQLRRTNNRVGLLLDEKTYLPGLTTLIGKSKFKAQIRHARTSNADSRCRFINSPLKHGKLVDDQISAYIKELCEKSSISTNTSTRPMKNTARKANWDPCTQRIIEYLHKMKWTPIAQQFPVFSSLLGFGTLIDFICTDENNQLIVVELKTSRHNTCKAYESTTHNKKFGWPLENKLASPLEQHLLQPFVASELLKRYYKIYPSVSGVLRVGANKIWFYETSPSWCDRKTATALLKVFSQLAKNKTPATNAPTPSPSPQRVHRIPANRNAWSHPKKRRTTQHVGGSVLRKPYRKRASTKVGNKKNTSHVIHRHNNNNNKQH
jgi:hypothetical protein